MSDRHIEVTGSASFATRAICFPVELVLTSVRQASNAERFRLAKTMDTFLNALVEAGVPAERIPLHGEGDPMRFLRPAGEGGPSAVVRVDCATADELAQVHGLASKTEHGDSKLIMNDLAPIYADDPGDRARAFRTALDNAGRVSAAIAHEAGVKLGPLIFAREIADGTGAPDTTIATRITVNLLTRFEIKQP